jgi:hypothetical protein
MNSKIVIAILLKFMLVIASGALAKPLNTQIYEQEDPDEASFVDQVKNVREIAGEWEVLFEEQKGAFGLREKPNLQPLFIEAQRKKQMVQVKYNRDSRQILEGVWVSPKDGNGLGSGREGSSYSRSASSAGGRGAPPSSPGSVTRSPASPSSAPADGAPR